MNTTDNSNTPSGVSGEGSSERRILIDCAFISKANAMTGIPRVVFKYIEWGYKYGREHEVTVLPVYVKAGGVFDARPNLPAWTHDAPLFARTLKELTGVDPKIANIRIDGFRNRQRRLRKVAVPVFHALMAPVALLAGREHTENFRQRYREWLHQTTLKLSEAMRVKVREGDVIIMPGYWHDELPSSYSALHRAGVRIVPLVHDLLPITMPEHYNEGWRDQFRDRVLDTLAICDHAMFISEATRSDGYSIIDDAGMEVPPSSVHHHGFDYAAPITASGVEPNPALVTSMALSPFNIIVVGSVEPKKNHLLLLRECQTLWSSGLDFNLIVIGRPGWMSKDIVRGLNRHHLSGKKLFWFQNLSDSDLDYAYANANLCVLPSVAEGFGLPLIEALAQKQPVLASDIAPFREIAGSSANFFDHHTPGALADALRKLICNPDAYRDLKTRARSFSWRTWEVAVNEVFDKLLTINSRLVVDQNQD